MRNDAIYKEGRLLLDDQGKGIMRQARVKRAVADKTDFGKEVITFSWIEHEYGLMQIPPRCRRRRAAAHRARRQHDSDGVLRRGEPSGADAERRDVGATQAQPMFDRLLWHVELMLGQNRVHGDLSAYNVLYWGGGRL